MSAKRLTIPSSTMNRIAAERAARCRLPQSAKRPIAAA
jgi:hypothetical protein